LRKRETQLSATLGEEQAKLDELVRKLTILEAEIDHLVNTKVEK